MGLLEIVAAFQAVQQGPQPEEPGVQVPTTLASRVHKLVTGLGHKMGLSTPSREENPLADATSVAVEAVRAQVRDLSPDEETVSLTCQEGRESSFAIANIRDEREEGMISPDEEGMPVSFQEMEEPSFSEETVSHEMAVENNPPRVAPQQGGQSVPSSQHLHPSPSLVHPPKRDRPLLEVERKEKSSGKNIDSSSHRKERAKGKKGQKKKDVSHGKHKHHRHKHKHKK